MRQLFIDMDGVVADFDAFYLEKFGVRLDRDSDVDPPGMWDNIKSIGTFYLDLPPMKDCHELWRGAKLLHPKPVFITGVPYSVMDAEAHKREWLKRHIGEDAEIVCCRSRDKRLHGKPGDILIDDWFKYRHLWEEMGGVFILHSSAADSLTKAAVYFK